MGNFVDLCRAPSNRVKGTPFHPVKAVAVDLFPQTPHCEMLILFERMQQHPNGIEALEHQEFQTPRNLPDITPQETEISLSQGKYRSTGKLGSALQFPSKQRVTKHW